MPEVRQSQLKLLPSFSGREHFEPPSGNGGQAARLVPIHSWKDKIVLLIMW